LATTKTKISKTKTSRATTKAKAGGAKSPGPASKTRRGVKGQETVKMKAPKGPRVRKSESPLLVPNAPPPPPIEASKYAREIALLIAEAGLDRKAINVEIIDVAGKVDYADLIILMTGTSDRHVAGLVQNIEDELREKRKLHAIAVEGLPIANWVLVDFGDVVVHVFQESARDLYDIGSLWIDASRVPVPVRAQPASGGHAGFRD
jgi:ribosome-associated protein